ncbi:MAG: uroporphyrinogen-III C-methyltransferase [Shewanella sp.]
MAAEAAPQAQLSDPTADAKAESAPQSMPQTAPQTKPQTAPQAKPASKPEPVAPPKSSWAIRLGVMLALGLSACTLGGAALLYQTLQQQLQMQQQTQEANNDALQAQLQQALQLPNQRLGQLEQQQLNDAKTYQDLSKLAASQDQLSERLNQLAARSPTHWMAAEADYLVNMAGRKLWLEKDPRTAVNLLKSADETIVAMNNPALLPIRKALAQDIAATASIKVTDIDGGVLALDALIGQLDALPLNRSDSQSASAADSQISSNLTDWQTNLAKTWKAITQDFITIRHRTADAPALLAPQQQWYLIENIRHKLLQSQLALYRYDKAAYQQALMMAREWLQNYFDTQDSKTIDIIAEIDKLAKIELEPITIQSFSVKPLLLQLTSYGELAPAEGAPL